LKQGAKDVKRIHKLNITHLIGGTVLDRLLASSAPIVMHSCSRHDVVTARLTSHRPGSVILLSKTLTPFRVQWCLQPPSMFLKLVENNWWCVLGTSPLSILPHHPRTR